MSHCMPHILIALNDLLYTLTQICQKVNEAHIIKGKDSPNSR